MTTRAEQVAEEISLQINQSAHFGPPSYRAAEAAYRRGLKDAAEYAQMLADGGCSDAEYIASGLLTLADEETP